MPGGPSPVPTGTGPEACTFPGFNKLPLKEIRSFR
jgi:hypothetical protein